MSDAQRIWQLLADVPDPEIPVVSVVDLGMVRDVDIREDAKKEAAAFLRSDDAKAPEGQKLLQHVIDLWGERFGLVAGA